VIEFDKLGDIEELKDADFITLLSMLEQDGHKYSSRINKKIIKLKNLEQNSIYKLGNMSALIDDLKEMDNNAKKIINQMPEYITKTLPHVFPQLAKEWAIFLAENVRNFLNNNNDTNKGFDELNAEVNSLFHIICYFNHPFLYQTEFNFRYSHEVIFKDAKQLLTECKQYNPLSADFDQESFDNALNRIMKTMVYFSNEGEEAIEFYKSNMPVAGDDSIERFLTQISDRNDIFTDELEQIQEEELEH